MLSSIFSKVSQQTIIQTASRSIQQNGSLLGPSLIAQKCFQFIAHKEGSTNLLDRVSGYEADIEKRKAITQAFKDLGLRWNQDKKSWVPSKPTELAAIQDILNQPQKTTPVAAPRAKSGPSEYEARIDQLLSAWDAKLSALLPKHITKERFIESLRLALIQSKKAGEQSSDQSLYKACSLCAQTGLTPGPLNEAYFSTRDNQIEFLIGYKGIISLATRALPGLIVESNVVREGDLFNYTLGTRVFLEYAQKSNEDSDKIVQAYVFITFPDGTGKITVIDQEHVNKRKSCSKGANAPTSPWNKFPREMWLKTAIRDAFRFISLSGDYKGFSQIDREFLLKLQNALKAEIDETQPETKDSPESTK